MSTIEIIIPDLGGAADVEVIDILVNEGDIVEADQPLITVESDKASMDIPTSAAGKIVSLKVNAGDTVNEGDVMATIEATAEAEAGAAPEKAEAEAKTEAAAEAAPACLLYTSPSPRDRG